MREMRTRSPALETRRRGAAAVELALLIPLLAFGMAASIDYARIFYYGMILDGCARNGALYGQLTSNDPVSPYTSLQAAALADAGSLSPAPTVTAGYSSSSSGPFTQTTQVSPGYVQVTVSWTFQPILQYPGIPSQTSLTRVCLMPVPPASPVNN
jgi:Flp pilus assembly protein TadG